MRWFVLAAILLTVVGDSFDNADLNGDGKISKAEFRAVGEKAKAALKTVLDEPPALAKKEAAEKKVVKSGIGLLPELHAFWPAFINSLMMIWATEVGDKTFFIAAILAMRNDRAAVYVGAISALAVMTVLSALMGLVLPNLLPRKYTALAGACLFLYFGLKLLWDARSMGDGASDELEEVEEELGVKGNSDPAEREQMLESGIPNEVSPRDGVDAALSEVSHSSSPTDGGRGAAGAVIKAAWFAVFWQSCTMTFVAEWGDRSQIATVALAAAKDPYGVVAGAVVGHSMCTGLAVIGGRYLATQISERTVTYVGGSLFLLFAMHGFVTGT